jgi:tryptophan synthase alpha chain
MKTRIEHTFAKLKTEKRAALIPFIMGGDPNLATSKALLAALPAAGADLIEIGIPFSDPMADGPTIQAAGLRALAAGATLAGVLQLVREFRAANADTPIILMGYYNPIYRYGVSRFCDDALAAGVDGLIIVDLPPEEDNEMRGDLDRTGLKLIRLLAPTSDDARLPKLVASASGFVYYISVAGITGAKSASAADLQEPVARIRRHTSLPLAIGFGIRTPQQVAEVSPLADAVVVGSALVDVISRAATPEAAVAEATRFVRELSAGLSRK